METPATRPSDSRIFWISVLLLFLEMLVIRWVSVEVRIFAHLKNLVLISAFLGAGLGSFHAARPAHLWLSAAFLAATVLLVVNPLGVEALSMQRITEFLSSLSKYYFYEVKEVDWTASALGLGWTLVVFGLIAATFYPIGQLLGAMFDAHPKPLRAYAVNLAGSLVGILLFVVLSAYSMPPVAWFGVAAAIHLGLVLARSRSELLAIPLLGVVLALVAFPRDPGRTVWSPYQKLTLLSGAAQGETLATSRHTIRTNNTGYQGMLDLSDGSGLPAEERKRSQYNFPYRLLAEEGPDDVLIVGAGSGNDASGALRNGARHVDAVEIDPVILEMGRDLHPERPYSDPRVNPVVDDARSFFKKTTRRYDLAWFGLADSVTLSSTHNNVRLDHYLYTVESLHEVASLLKPGGVVVMTYSVTDDFIADRIKGLFHEVFGRAPIIFIFPWSDMGWGGVCFVGGPEASMRQVEARIAAQPWVREWIDQLRPARDYPMETPLTTDDWPYLFHPVAGIPAVHLVVTGLLLALLVGGKRVVLGRGRVDLHFFCLGGGFLLLEVQNISKASLLFGATWTVNAFIISAILLMAFLSTLFVAWARPGRTALAVAWLLLLATILANYFLPLDLLNRLPFASRVALASAFLTSPVFFSGIVFSTSFARVEGKAAALGANLLGAIVGGMLESLSFVVGVRALLLVAGFFYVGAWARDRSRFGRPVV